MTDPKHFCPSCGLALPAANPGQGCPHCLLRLALTPDEETDLVARQKRDVTPLPVGLRTRFFADYEILEEIAHGGMGVIYKARQLSLNRLVALKMIQASQLFSAEARLRFRMEVEAAAQLNHPHIVPLYESGEHEGMHFFTMRLVEGGSLARWIEKEKTRKGEEAENHKDRRERRVTLLIKVARAVHYAHQRGILHRDLKPSNILLDAQGEPHVADFGLAKILAQEGDFTFTESILGSPNYMAPEQASGHQTQITIAADVYGLGAILYELLTGQPPFKAATPLETIRKVCDEEPVSPRKLNPSIDADLGTIALKCLRKESAARYGSAEDLAADLERWRDGRPILARPVSVLEHAWRWCRRQPALASALGVSLLLLIALAVGTAVAGLRIRNAERQAAAHLRETLLARTQMLRGNGEMGQRAEGLRLLGEAAALGGPAEFRDRLRDELLATLALSDMSFAAQPQLQGGSLDPAFTIFDSTFAHHASTKDGSNIVIRRVSDGEELIRFSVEPTPVTQLEQFSHNGRFLGLRHREGISIWDVETGTPIFATNGPQRVFLFAPRKPVMALEDWDCQVSVRELPSLRELQRIETPPDEAGSKSRSQGWSAMVFAPDGRQLAAARAQDHVVELFDLESPKRLRFLTNAQPVLSLAWNPRQSYLAAGGADSRVRLWDPYSGRYRGSRLLPAPARSLAYSPGGSLLAAACEDRVVRLWQSHGSEIIFSSLSDGQRIAFTTGGRVGPVLRGDSIGWLEVVRPAEFVDEQAVGNFAVASCQFGVDGNMVGVGWKTQVGFFDPSGFRPLGSLSARHPLMAFRLDPLGEWLLDADAQGIGRRAWRKDSGGLWELSSRESLIPGTGWAAMAFSARGEWFAAANAQSNMLVVADRTLTNRMVELGPHPGADFVAISPDGRWVATGSRADRRIRVWDVKTGLTVHEVAAGGLPRAAFSPDGRWLATFGDIFELRETASWRSAPALPFPEDRPLLGAAAFSPDSRMLAVVRDQFTVQLFDLETFQSLGVLTPPNEAVMTVLEFSPDGGRLVAGCLTGRLRSWDLRRVRQQLATFSLDWKFPSLSKTSSAPLQRIVVTK